MEELTHVQYQLSRIAIIKIEALEHQMFDYLAFLLSEEKVLLAKLACTPS